MLEGQFFNPRRYDLGRVGRYKVNTRLNTMHAEIDDRCRVLALHNAHLSPERAKLHVHPRTLRLIAGDERQFNMVQSARILSQGVVQVGQPVVHLRRRIVPTRF